ncbi:hypothetical protein D3C72_1893710 [compost metagenome]
MELGFLLVGIFCVFRSYRKYGPWKINGLNLSLLIAISAALNIRVFYGNFEQPLPDLFFEKGCIVFGLFSAGYFTVQVCISKDLVLRKKVKILAVSLFSPVVLLGGMLYFGLTIAGLLASESIFLSYISNR